jgi:8-oxo-dGTP pyrophosphatase MutT (NUDIX family)
MQPSKACGFVLVRDGAAGREHLLLTNARRSEPGLPKGHEESGETEIETALRETAEETGLTDLDVDPWFRATLRYPAERRGAVWDKTVVYFLATVRSGEVRLSREHSAYAWVPLDRALEDVPHASLRGVLRAAALFAKDPALFALHPASEADADRHLAALPEATPRLLGHLRGGARLARTFASALEAKGERVHVEAAAMGTLLHDCGRALGRHGDHQLEGLKHLTETPLAPYRFACISHFTKGASFEDLVAAGLSRDDVEGLFRAVDGRRMTWEERCAALADACMRHDEKVPPAERFAELRRRYQNGPLIDLQERRTGEIRAEMSEVLGRDPLALVGLA